MDQEKPYAPQTMAMMKIWLSEKLEKLLTWLAWRSPRKLVYWCAIRLLADKNPLDVDARRPSDALQRWREK